MVNRYGKPVSGGELAIAWLFISAAANTAYRVSKTQEKRLQDLEQRLERTANEAK